MTPRAGVRLGGRYELEERIGRGGAGLVWRARHTTIGRRFAIKMLVDACETCEHTAEALLAEARTLSALDHPNVVDVIDFGYLSPGHPYAVMELLDGHPLRHALGEPLPWGTALRWMLQALDGLEAAHESGIVHRDITPTNLFLQHDDTIKLIDFGLATEREFDGDTDTVGTPSYMSPEQIRGQAVDARSDLYSLGCVLFEMLTGAPPFEGTAHERLAQHLDAAPPRPQLGDDVPAHVADVVQRCLAKNPEDRPASADALRNALLYPPRRRARWPWVAGIVAAAIALGIAAQPEAPSPFTPVHVDLPSVQMPAASLGSLDAELPTFEIAERLPAQAPAETKPAKARRIRRAPAASVATFHPPEAVATAAAVPQVAEPASIQKVGGLKNPFLARQDEVAVGYPAASPTGP
ncbi:MAG: serine/threonine-protein kinase [Myxococcota bacterium]